MKFNKNLIVWVFLFVALAADVSMAQQIEPPTLLPPSDLTFSTVPKHAPEFSSSVGLYTGLVVMLVLLKKRRRGIE